MQKYASANPQTFEDLPPYTRHWTEISVAWMDQFWDPAANLIWQASAADLPHPKSKSKRRHSVRETSWYALGLLMRRQGDDIARAQRAIDAVLGCQFDEPGKVYHGTFYRSPEEDPPPEPAVEWRDYDPNWREFIGTTLALILENHSDLLSPGLIRSIDVALRKAAEGASERNVRPGYTNIALMSAYLLDYVGHRLETPAWRKQADTLARDVYALFAPHRTFEEYNSPTYYGTDLYALAQWRAYGLTNTLRNLGAAMEADLWRDIADFYHAGLRNVAGPYDRSYGMDLTRYLGLVGLWIGTAVEPELAPLPDVNQVFEHSPDFCFMPLVAAVGSEIPADATDHLHQFVEPRHLKRIISPNPERIATAWIDENVMIGGEHTSASRPGLHQFHPATLHWQTPDGTVGWIRLLCPIPVDAVVQAGQLHITCYPDAEGNVSPEIDFRISGPKLDPKFIQTGLWQLPGLTLQVDEPTTPGVSRLDEHTLEVAYSIDSLNKTIELTLTVQNVSLKA